MKVRRFFLVTLVCLAPAWACSDNSNPDAGGRSSSSSGGETSSSSGDNGGSSSSSGEGASSSSGSEPLGCPGDGSSAKVRFVAGNLTGEPQKYDDTGIDIFKGLVPDIALVQEMNYGGNSDGDIRSFVDQAFGSDFDYVRGAGRIPNGVVSRYPILQSGHITDSEVGDRDFVWARIDVPGDRHVLAFSVHLLTSAGPRGPQARGLMSAIDSVVEDGDYVLLGGDFNTANRTASGMSSIAERFVTSGPYPVDEDGVDGTNNSRESPYDWIVANEDLHALASATVIGPLEFPAGLVFDSRVFSDLSLVAPVTADDSDELQHMAVVRTFTFCQ